MTSPEQPPVSRARKGAHGQICVWPGGILWIGVASAPGTVHSHHAIQLAFGDDQPLHFRQGHAGDSVAYDGCLIPAHLPHALNSTDRRSAVIFVDPESAEGTALHTRTTPDTILRLDPAETRAASEHIFSVWAESHDCARLVPAARQLVANLSGAPQHAPTSDPRVLGAIELIKSRLDQKVALPDIARELNVSPSRLRHLFADEVGLPFKTFVLWQRLQRAVQLQGTSTLTQAALSAGFADAAHMTRTFRRMLGMAPSAFIRE